MKRLTYAHERGRIPLNEKHFMQHARPSASSRKQGSGVLVLCAVLCFVKIRNAVSSCRLPSRRTRSISCHVATRGRLHPRWRPGTQPACQLHQVFEAAFLLGLRLGLATMVTSRLSMPVSEEIIFIKIPNQSLHDEVRSGT